MQNTYQEKLAELEVNNSKKIKKLEGGINFKIKSDFQPSGDQPEAIKQILKNLKDNKHCLLYTSPSPRDVEESRMPSSA